MRQRPARSGSANRSQSGSSSLKREVVGHPVHRPGLGRLLERAEHERVPFAAEVDAQVRVAADRQLVEGARDRLGDDVVVLDRVQRQGHAAAQCELAAPHPAAQDDVLRPDRALVGADAGGAAVGVFDVEDADVLQDRRAAVAGALGQREGELLGDDLAVVGQPGGAEHVVGPQERPLLPGRVGADEVDVHPEPLGHGGGPAKLGHPLGRPRHDEAADLLPPGRVAGLPLQPGVQLGAVLVDPRHAVAGAEPADQPGRVPGRAAGEPALLQQDDVVPAELGEVVGDATADDPAADDDDLRLAGRRGVHAGTSANQEPVFRGDSPESQQLQESTDSYEIQAERVLRRVAPRCDNELSPTRERKQGGDLAGQSGSASGLAPSLQVDVVFAGRRPSTRTSTRSVRVCILVRAPSPSAAAGAERARPAVGAALPSCSTRAPSLPPLRGGRPRFGPRRRLLDGHPHRSPDARP